MLAIVTGLLAVGPAPADDGAATVAQVIATSRHPWLTWGDVSDQRPMLARIYEGEPDGLFWFDGGLPHPAAAGAVLSLVKSGERGLDPSDYDATRIAAEWSHAQFSIGRFADRGLLDVAISVGVLRLLAAVQHGRIDPRQVAFDYDVEPRRLDRAAVLREARDGKGIPATLDALEPPFAHYARAEATLARYKALAADGDGMPVPAPGGKAKKVEPGQAWPGVAALRARLVQLGDLAPDAPAGQSAADGTPLYAGEVVEAAKRFQARHLLDADGVIGGGTLEALNVPLTARVRQIELAMERMRWLPELGGRPLIFVNVPLFRLWGSDPARGGEPLRMNVVVGKSMSHRTPLFVGQMRYVIFRPYWNPPRSITVNELLPRARQDASYLAREHMEIVASGDEGATPLPAVPENLEKVAAGRLFLRQRPGPHNSLGLAKFIFPNSSNVYMHGTPAQALFGRVRRDFSHGCIRLEDAGRMAEWLLHDRPEWTKDRIEAAMLGRHPQQVNLKQPPTVVIFYDTVHVNSENVVRFAADIYGHDRTLDLALRRGYPYP